MIIATAGHVDHGKTSLLRALTRQDADRLPEEKARGLTIDLGFVYDTQIAPGHTIGFVDVPGHSRFVRNMLAGVTGIRAALLVIAADDGPMPQTLEHLAVLDLVGVREGLVALTKADRVSPARLDAARGEVARLLEGTGLADAPVLPVSSTTGEGVAELAARLRALAESAPAPDPRGNFRLAIDRAFHVDGTGLVVTGLVQSGRAGQGETLRLEPSGRDVRIRGLRVQNRQAEVARAGDRCAINLAGRVEKADIHRGDWLVAPRVAPASARLDVDVRLLATHDRPLKRDTPVHVHLGSADIPGRLFLLDRATLAPGESALAQIVLSRPAVAAAGDAVILRNQSARETLGGGRIVDPQGVQRGRGAPARLAWLAALRGRGRAAALQSLLEGMPGGVPLGALDTAWNLDPAEAEAMRARVPVVASGADGDAGLTRGHAEALRCAILDALAHHHRSQPERAGPDRTALARMLPRPCLPAALDAAVSGLVAAGEAVRAGPFLRLASHAPRLNAEDGALWARAKPLLEAPGRPPVISELAAALDIAQDRAEALLARAAMLGEATRVTPNRYLTQATLRRLADLAEDGTRQAADEGFTAAEFRDRSGLGRNLTIEMLEYFDRLGFTRRDGGTRKTVRPAGTVFGTGDGTGTRAAMQTHTLSGRGSDPGGPHGLQTR
ncbi:selenocysteine-specific translation elongation factor [Futiania mangrovi]|uniref:selenocysteine-specific translation elongation factor n=1 Tax=Futiania mangrovi TaxID=2959716 RepID=UPI0038B3418E